MTGLFTLYYVYFIFFFFKLKTAYVMRISDWSSDVCSSDLFGTLLSEGYLARQADLIAFAEQGAEPQRLAGRPVEILARLEHLGAAVDDAAQRLVDVDIVGNRRDRAADRVEQLALDPRFDVAPRARVVLGRIEPCPAAGEPVGLVRLVIGAELEFLFQVGDEFVAVLRDEIAVDHAFLDQPRAEQVADRRVLDRKSTRLNSSHSCAARLP